ncbi:GyrI-like domain-containing protein [Kribbella sp. VKM Ac-2566]|jgi:effector-binding domain-containing protein|uniref:GyrI-like domain-containing protein n=1 Tax=Kribbella sp. VKM Ac-2566 TaxID=2512218 RepID=UPI00106419B1|nr:GyrI-like domain-containing protein [Kribbella sp. VKM Ac-2566]TDW91707.1 effector-binding domain-containing protein [Kribbella sp. VKM Ac-2566]
MDVLEPARVREWATRDCLGIRVVTPFRGMLGKRNELLDELIAWLADQGIDDVGPFFLRLHVIDMSGPMDLEVGVLTPTALAGDARVKPSTLPAGRYATLTYRNHSLRANRALLEWAAAEELALDRHETAAGDVFGCRYEAYRTDPRTEPRKTKWEVELGIRLAD